jgi:hypothetical protein
MRRRLILGAGSQETKLGRLIRPLRKKKSHMGEIPYLISMRTIHENFISLHILDSTLYHAAGSQTSNTVELGNPQ